MMTIGFANLIGGDDDNVVMNVGIAYKVINEMMTLKISYYLYNTIYFYFS